MLIMNAILFMNLIGISAASFVIGRLFTEGSIKLPYWLDMKPFNCRKCLTTWTSWVLNTLVALIVGSVIYFICGTISSAVIFWLIYNEEKKQWE